MRDIRIERGVKRPEDAFEHRERGFDTSCDILEERESAREILGALVERGRTSIAAALRGRRGDQRTEPTLKAAASAQHVCLSHRFRKRQLCVAGCKHERKQPERGCVLSAPREREFRGGVGDSEERLVVRVAR